MAGTGSRGGARRRGAGELENEVLGTLWAAGRPLTPAEVRTEIGGGLAYNTVHTILRRLQDKGLVRQDLGGRRGAYRPAKDAAELTAEAMHRALDRGPDPVAALSRFVSGLSAEQERALRDLLGAARTWDSGRERSAPGAGRSRGTAPDARLGGHGPGRATA